MTRGAVILIAIVSLGGVARAEDFFSGGFLGIGGGVVHSKGPVAHASTSVYRNFEAHYSFWHNGERDHAAGFSYRFQNEVSPISVALGFAYIGTITENLLRHEDAYIEIRIDLARDFACQASHYSTIGDDNGENFLLCGVRWGAAKY